MFMLCLFTCAAYLVMLRMDTMCSKVSCCVDWASMSWFTCSLILLTSFVVAAPVSPLRLSPKKGSRLLLWQLLLFTCSSNEGSMFKRLIAEMIVGRIFHCYWWVPLVVEILSESELQVCDLETVIADVFYPLVYRNISNDIPGGQWYVCSDYPRMACQRWDAFKIGWKRTDSPILLLDDVLMRLVMHKML